MNLSDISNDIANDKVQVKIRQGKKEYIFKKDWEEGNDPSKPYIEIKDADGKVKQRRPVSKAYNICDMKDEDLDDFLGEDEKKALKEARRQRKESQGRDICKEYHEKKKKDDQKRVDILEERNKILEENAIQIEDKFTTYKSQTDAKIEKLASLLQQLLKK